MFAKRPAPAAAPSRPQADGRDWIAALANPYVGAGGAGLLFLISVLVLVMAAGDPHAGAPSIRIPLQEPHAPGGHGPLRGLADPTLPGLADGVVTLDNLAPGQDVLLPGAPDPSAPIAGEAVITLPQGATMGAGGQRVTARSSGPPLPAAPAAGLTEPGPGGLLPIVGRDGRTPFQAYARPFRDTGKPRIALVVGGLGPECRGHALGHRAPARRSDPFVRPLRRRAAGLDRPRPRRRPRGDDRDPHGAAGLS